MPHPSEHPITTDSEAPRAAARKRRRLIRYCASAALLLLTPPLIFVIFKFTPLRAKYPTIYLNKITVVKIYLINGTANPRPGTNLTITADISVTNPNFASLKFPNTTTEIYYNGTMIGEARGPPGKMKANRTMRMNFTVEFVIDRILSQPGFFPDFNSGVITVRSYTEVGGRVKFFLVKKHVTVRMNCTFTYNTTAVSIQLQKCRRKVKL